MGKGKHRHDPDKPQNLIGSNCSYYEGNEKTNWCERGWDVTKCKGSPHNCCKVKYQILASKSDEQKEDGIGITNSHY